jgi:hypothetical protein
MVLMPKSDACYDYLKNNYRTRKNVWLVPHVIRKKDDSEIITWRCNWGGVCESECLYAMVKDRKSEISGSHLQPV